MSEGWEIICFVVVSLVASVVWSIYTYHKDGYGGFP